MDNGIAPDVAQMLVPAQKKDGNDTVGSAGLIVMKTQQSIYFPAVHQAHGHFRLYQSSNLLPLRPRREEAKERAELQDLKPFWPSHFGNP